jgi:hypothetical protein
MNNLNFCREIEFKNFWEQFVKIIFFDKTINMVL